MYDKNNSLQFISDIFKRLMVWMKYDFLFWIKQMWIIGLHAQDDVGRKS